MRAVVQRVSAASVTVSGCEAGSIGAGLLVLLGIHKEDGQQDIAAIKTHGISTASGEFQAMMEVSLVNSVGQ